MRSKFICLTICFFLTISMHKAWSANYYVLYDAACMDVLLYANAEGGATSEYLMYRINTSAAEHIFLEIGTENQRTQEVLPTQVFTCGSNLFDSKFVESVNSGKDRIFLVIRKGNNQYTLSPVTQASYYQFSNSKITYQSPRYGFQLDARNGIIGDNITTRAKTEMFFEGKLENDCSGAFLFTQRVKSEARPYSSLVFVPEIGITEIQNGQDATDAVNHALRLEKVNNYPVVDYLRLLCKRTQPTNTNQLTERGVVQEYDVTPRTPYPNLNTAQRSNTITQPSTATSPTLTARSANNPCGIEAGSGYHVVTKGETLYRISKTYSVTVSQIQTWNNLGSSTNIHNCDRLRVAPPSAAGNSGTAATGTVIRPYPSVVDSRPAVTVPAPYDTYSPKGVQNYDNTNAAWRMSEQYYIVKPGETVASIALKYGLTEARLRDINGMRPTEVLKVEQPIKVTDCPPVTNYNNGPTEYNNTGRPGEFTSKSPYNFQDETRISPQFYQPSQGELPRQTGNTSTSQDLTRRMVPSGADNTIPQNYDVSNLPRSQRSIHLVKEGENLYQISRAYGVTVERLRQLNSLGPNDVIIPFQKIYVN